MTESLMTKVSPTFHDLYINSTGSTTVSKKQTYVPFFIVNEDTYQIDEISSLSIGLSVTEKGINLMDKLKSKSVDVVDTNDFILYINTYQNISQLLIDACDEILNKFKQEIEIKIFMNKDIDYPEETYPVILFNLDEYPENTYETLISIRRKFYDYFRSGNGFFRILTDFD